MVSSHKLDQIQSKVNSRHSKSQGFVYELRNNSIIMAEEAMTNDIPEIKNNLITNKVHPNILDND